MSPIVYEPHDCEPPWQGEVYNNGVHKELMYPDGTIWECNECASEWESVYYWGRPSRGQDVKNRSHNAKVLWNRLDYYAIDSWE